MYTYGIEVPNSMMKGMKENYAVLEEGAKGAAYIIDMTTGTAIEEISPSFGKYLTDMGLSGFSSMNSALKNKKLNAPKMKDIDADAYINKNTEKFFRKIGTSNSRLKTQVLGGQNFLDFYLEEPPAALWKALKSR